MKQKCLNRYNNPHRGCYPNKDTQEGFQSLLFWENKGSRQRRKAIKSMPKVLVGMSGGVDSAVAAYLLKQQGYDVIGVTLRIWTSEDGKESRCCEIDDARRVAMQLGIPYYALNCIDDFERCVSVPFMESYIAGKTPNPCVVCNRFVKWDRLLYYAKIFNADYVATGHYAFVVQLPNGRYTVKRATHAQKDQTYMLYKLTQEHLQKTLMPLGGMSKDEVRAIAKTIDIEVASKQDSQEICFVTKGTYADYIKEHYRGDIPGEGNFVDEQGNILGRHKGIFNYTVGQRKGLELAFGYPVYVKEIKADTNEVVLGKADAIYATSIVCDDVSYMGIDNLGLGETLDCFAKVRYHHEAQKAKIEALPDGKIKISFEQPVHAPAPGQSAVFYDDNDCVIGGGTIIDAE